MEKTNNINNNIGLPPSGPSLARTKSEQLLEKVAAAIKSPPATPSEAVEGGGAALSRKSSRRLLAAASPGRSGGGSSKNAHIRKSRSAQMKFELDEVSSGAALSRASSASLGLSFSFTGFTVPPDEIADSKPFSDKDIRPNISSSGFLQSVTAVVWRSRPPEDRLPPPNQESEGKSSKNAPPDSSSKGSEGGGSKGGNLPPLPVQSTPPETMKIVSDQQQTRNVELEKHVMPEVVKPEVNAVKVEVKEEGPKPSETAKPKKPTHIKRLSSTGLQIESVLGRKTANLKDFYSLGRKLGQGQFGTTFLCLEKGTEKEFACKTIAKRKLTTDEDVEDVRREIQIMHHLAGHPNVIQIMGAYEDAVAVHVVMELCAGGELFDRIIQRGHYTERKAAQLARIIVGVVQACHSLGVMHRDLKPENFLFVNHEEEAPLKTIDFGLSMFFKPGETFTDVVGSPYYVAPEVLRKHYGPECDVWSAGVIIYILLSGVPPFWDETEQGIFEQVLKGELDFVSEPWPSISESAKDLVRRMLVRDPKKRLTAHEVLCHPWVQVDGVAPDKPLDSAVLTRLKQFSAMNKLKKIAIRVIAESLSEEEIAGLKEMFKMIDTDNSGQITLEELKTGLERVGANVKDSEIHRLMQAADIDNSGTIDYGEFVAAMLHLNKVQKEDHLYAAFSYFDKDGSGYITPDELQQVCEKFGLENVQLDDIIREVDQDNDSRIDYNEFVAMMQDTGLVKKGLQNNKSMGMREDFKQ